MKIVATQDRLIVKEVKATEAMQGKIIKPDIEGVLSNLFEVADAGEDCKSKVGDKVFVKKVFVSPIDYKGETFGSVREIEILAYLKDVE